MITIPNKKLSPQGNEDLAIICEAIFLDIKDKRLISILCTETIEERVNILRESIVCESLYNMVNIFGEEDFIRFVVPYVDSMSKDNYSNEDYLKIFEKHFKGVL